MSLKHVPTDTPCLPSRSVTRRDALRLFIGAGICATIYPAVALAETTQEKLDAAQLDYDEAQAELEAIGAQVEEAASALGQTQGQVLDLSQQIGTKAEEIDAKQAEIDTKQGEIDTKQGEIESKQEEIEQKQAVLGERMSSAYKAGSSSTLDLLLSSATIEELTSNIYYLDKVSESDRDMIDEVKTLKAELEQQKADLEVEKADLEVQKADLETQKVGLEDERADLEVLQAQQQEQLAEVRARQAESEALVSNLSDEVQELLAQRDAELLAAQQAAEEARRQRELEEQRQQLQQNHQTNSGSSSWTGGNTEILGTGPLASVVSASYSTPSPGSGLCAAWVSTVFQRAGVGTFYGNADDMYYQWCGYSVSQIKPGMIVATSSVPYSAAALIYGHVGIYVGNNTVRHNQSGVVKTDSLDSWVSMYSVTVPVRCGWLGGVALS